MDDVTGKRKQANWRKWSVAYLLMAALMFGLTIWVARRHGMWYVVAVVAVYFLVRGARMSTGKKA